MGYPIGKDGILPIGKDGGTPPIWDLAGIPPVVNKQTFSSINITFPRTLYAGVKKFNLIIKSALGAAYNEANQNNDHISFPESLKTLLINSLTTNTSLY